MFEIANKFYSKEDGCEYFYDKVRETWCRLCYVQSSDLPLDVRNQIQKAKAHAEFVLSLPLDDTPEKLTEEENKRLCAILNTPEGIARIVNKDGTYRELKLGKGAKSNV